MWVYKEQDFSSGAETVEDVYSNLSFKKIKNGNKFNAGFSYHEQRPKILQIIDQGIATYEDVPSTTIPNETEHYLPGERGIGDDGAIILKKRNANESVCTIDSINITKGGVATPLDPANDYDIGVDTFGFTRIKLKTWGLIAEQDPLTAKLSIIYEVTPPAHISVAHAKSAVAQGFLAMYIWKGSYGGNDMEIRIVTDNTVNDKSFTQFKGDSDDDTAGFPCAFSGNIIYHEFKWFGTLA